MNYKRIEKGSVIGSNWFYVVVEAIIVEGQLYLNCICDNANNVYSFTLDNVLGSHGPHNWIVLSPLMAIKVANWSGLYELDDKDQEIFNKIGRTIPVDVIAEVLSGKHDNRFGR